MPAAPPFCHCFRTQANPYVYDINSGEIVRVAEDLWQLLKPQDGLPGEGDDGRCLPNGSDCAPPTPASVLAAVLDAQEHNGLFLGARPPRDRHIVTEHEVESALQHGLPHLILKVTPACNMRCAYCIYSSEYSRYPSYRGNAMTWETAKRAIDYFAPRANADATRPGMRPVLSFYGGEPLLELDLVKRCVNYAEVRVPGGLDFAITTNGTLLDATTGAFLAEHDFVLTVSVDGPQGIHDRSRRLADGAGTFRSIVANLCRLKMSHPEYYARRCVFSMTLEPEDAPGVSEFLAHSDIAPRVVHAFPRMPTDREIMESVGSARSRELQRAVKELPRVAATSNLHDLAPSEYIATGYWLFAQGLQRVYRRPRGPVASCRDWLHSGACIPGCARLLVDPRGRLFACQDMPPHAANCIGTVQSGISTRDVAAGLNRFYGLTAAECPHCWGVRMCGICQAQPERVGVTSPEGMQPLCTRERAFLHWCLVLMCEILERNPDALTLADAPIVV